MNGYHSNIEEVAKSNTNFRQVLYTGKHSQLVAMCIQVGEDIGQEIHVDNDQFFRIEQGQGRCVIDGNEFEIAANDAIVIPAGAEHNIINTSREVELKLYTIYSPAHHKDGIVRATKADAIANEAEFDGKMTE